MNNNTNTNKKLCDGCISIECLKLHSHQQLKRCTSCKSNYDSCCGRNSETGLESNDYCGSCLEKGKHIDNDDLVNEVVRRIRNNEMDLRAYSNKFKN